MLLFEQKPFKRQGAIDRFLHDRTGASLMEYALVLGLVALISTIAFQGVGTATGNLLGKGQTAMADVESGAPGGGDPGTGGDPGAGGGSGGPGGGGPGGGGPGGGGPGGGGGSGGDDEDD